MTTTPTTSPHRSRRGPISALAAAATTLLIVLPAAPASAHHGWDGFETDRLVYLAGTVSTEGTWGEPHSLFETTLDRTLPADTPELEIPEDLQDPEDSTRVEAALAYSGPHEELEVIIAPPAWSGRWGLGRALEVGERFQGVGYINRDDDGLFRPVVFWYGDDDVPVNQVLGSTLPVRAPLPAAAAPSAGSSAEQTPAETAADPLETPSPTTGESTSPTAGAEGDPGSTAGVWTVFGFVVLAALAGGFLYLRRATRRS
ncbi:MULTISPECIES: hypothetical protein [unclassified Rathayibacter]|uniref:hypothetical protein n=1 Tax=unclassified Rathayibacter TaxID=2609250 RepID=UPI000B234DDE|nr:MULTISPECIES: hypothetical protein [unclassified Rathayibacter]